MQLTVNVKGLMELQRKSDYDFLFRELLTNVREKLWTRINRRRRKKAGYINNPLAVQKYAIVAGNAPIAKVTTPLNNPRTTGASWQRFVFGLVRGSFLRNQINAEVLKMQARWNR